MNETRVYTASVECLENPGLYRRALELLPASRRESADRMKPLSGKRLAAGAGLLLMAALAEYPGPQEPVHQAAESLRPRMRSTESRNSGAWNSGSWNPGSWDSYSWNPEAFLRLRSIRYEQEEYGKPYLPDFPEVHFNLSHSGSRAMCIVSPVEVGCDVEAVEKRGAESVIRCLAESEQRLAAASAENFYRIWTLKESILKLSGKGLMIPLNSFEVSLSPLAVRQDFLPEPVRLKEYDIFRKLPEEERYCCSCAALEGAELPDEMIQVDLRGLLEHFV